MFEAGALALLAAPALFKARALVFLVAPTLSKVGALAFLAAPALFKAGALALRAVPALFKAGETCFPCCSGLVQGFNTCFSCCPSFIQDWGICSPWCSSVVQSWSICLFCCSSFVEGWGNCLPLLLQPWLRLEQEHLLSLVLQRCSRLEHLLSLVPQRRLRLEHLLLLLPRPCLRLGRLLSLAAPALFKARTLAFLDAPALLKAGALAFLAVPALLKAGGLAFHFVPAFHDNRSKQESQAYIFSIQVHIQEVHRLCKIAQRAQREATGYYCGYTFKRQPVGKHELKASAQSLNYARAGLGDKKPGRQFHRVSNRMVVDLQHRCMLRTAPEEFNLAANFDPHDVMAAEFKRTFNKIEFYGGKLLKLYDAERAAADAPAHLRALPVRRGDVSGAALVQYNFEDVYGYRGRDVRVYYLNPWEFLMYWEPVRYNMALIEEKGDQHPDIVVFPDTALLKHFRQEWMLVRRRAPFVPQPEGTPMPEREPTAEGRGKLYSIYMRPWVLLREDASTAVPQLKDLDVIVPDEDAPPQAKRRISVKRSEFPRSFAMAWSRYIRGRIVSHHAKRIITQFMAANCGKSKSLETNDQMRAREPDEGEKATENSFNVSRIHSLLLDFGKASDAPPDGVVDELKLSTQAKRGMQLSASLWGLDGADWSGERVDVSGEVKAVSDTHFDAGCVRTPALQTVQGKEPNVSHAYTKVTTTSVERWFSKISKEAISPNSAQLKYLRAVSERCAVEAAELLESKTKKKNLQYSEPLRPGLFGLPGAGKSECIRWTRRFFEECLGWMDGVQFQMLAPQHTMAALIGGRTVHGWGSIPINASAASEQNKKAGASDVDALFLKALSMRWLLIDEISNLGAMVFGLLDSFLKRACRRQPYAKRKDGSKRPFGGINLIKAGDGWQLPPVRAIGFFSNPFRNDLEHVEQKSLAYFWRKSVDSITGMFELTQPMRTSDEWLKCMLAQDRVGQETWETYCFTHGLPTRNVGTWLPGRPQPKCGNQTCAALAAEKWPDLFEQGASWSYRMSLECEACSAERRRRCRVMWAKGLDATTHLREPFAQAPYVHPFNAPKYHASQLRVVNYGKVANKRVLWVVAHDWPTAGGDEQLVGDALEKARRRWLQQHDKTTGGIMGLLPLVKGIPMRITATVDESLGAFKNARAELIGWELDPAETVRLEGCEAPEVELLKRPRALHLKLKTATKKLLEENADGIYVLKPKVVVWARDGAGQASVNRIGFTVVPELGGTIHGYCGDTLDAMIGDLLEWNRKPCPDDMHKAYISKSRVRRSEHMLLAQPYSPHLFRQGEMPGPHMLMRVLRGQITCEDAKAEWKRIEKQKAQTPSATTGNWNVNMPLPCRRCTDDAKGIEVWKPMQQFDMRSLSLLDDIWNKVVAQGQDLLCRKCTQKMFPRSDVKLMVRYSRYGYIMHKS